VKVDSNWCCATTDTNEILGIRTASNNETLKLWPNPANNFLNIEASFKIEQIEIVNTLGQTVLRHACNTAKESIDIGKLLPGLYFVQVNNIYTQKVVRG